jgi:hypothetical protein
MVLGVLLCVVVCCCLLLIIALCAHTGFLSALLNGCSLSDSLRVGGATSGYYVRNMESPTVEKTVGFLRNLPDIDDMPKD